MIEFLAGKIIELLPDFVIVQCGDIGYKAHISLMTYDALRNGGVTKIYTHVSIKEDSHSLYGFALQEERRIFRHLINVSGIGTNTARLILSSMSGQEVIQAISTENEGRFKNVKGIGAKTAKRIILDLKDKIGNVDLSSAQILEDIRPDIRSEALSALISLGFNRNAIIQILNSLLQGEHSIDTTEELIRIALQRLSS